MILCTKQSMLRAMGEMRSDLGVLLTAASRSFWERLRARLQQQGCREVRPNQDYVLRALACDTMTITALARQFGISKQAAVSLVDDLEQCGYAYREQSVTDRRIKLIHLTPAARQIVEATDKRHARNRRRARRRMWARTRSRRPAGYCRHW